jgi:hypothetical protein
VSLRNIGTGRAQDCSNENDLVKDLGIPDDQGVYQVASAVNGQCLFLRRAHTSVNGGFEWSIEKLVWLPTSKILEEVLCIDHEVRPCRCVRRLPRHFLD